MPLADSVAQAVDGLDLKPADTAAAALALTYARSIDAGDALDKVGPLLLACLESLLMTPKARAAAVRGGTGVDTGTSPLDELRARRAARQRDPASVDPASS